MSQHIPVQGPLLDGVTIEHGPADLGARFFLAADNLLGLRGITLSFATFEELMAINAANKDTWLPLLPAFDPACCDLSPERAFCWLGRDATGKVVVTQACRLFDWPRTNFFEEAATLRLMYDNPDRDKRPGEVAVMTAEGTRAITGRVAYSGAVWWHPSRRGSELPALMSRLSRYYAHSRWNVGFATGIMSEKVMKGGLSAKTGHPHIDWALAMSNTRWGEAYMGVLWMNQQELVEDVAHYMPMLDTQVDRVVEERRAQQN